MRVSNNYYNLYYPYIKNAAHNSQPVKPGEQPPDLKQSPDESFQSQVDYKAGNINAFDILEDFKSTLYQVGVTGYVFNNVNIHLNKVRKELNSPNPSRETVKLNFENAAKVLDSYISESLKKPSEVVTQWITALFVRPVSLNKKITGQPISPLSVANTSFQNQDTKTISNTNETNQLDEILGTPNTILAEIQSENENRITFNNNEFKGSATTNEEINNQSKKLSTQGLSRLTEADTLYDLGKKKEAEINYRRAIRYALKDKDLNTMGNGFFGVGLVRDDLGDIPNALKNYNQAAKISSKVGDYGLGAKSYYSIGSIYQEYNKPFLALEHYYTSLGFDGERNAIEEQSKTLQDIATIYKENSQPRKALKYFEYAYSFASKEGMTSVQSSILGNVGDIYRTAGKVQQAQQYYTKALAINEKFTGSSGENTNDYLKNLNDLVSSYLNSGNTALAKTLLNKSISFGRRTGNNKLRWAAQNTLLKIG